LRGIRQENRDLKAEIERMRIEQVRMSEDAGQARRLQTLLGFKEQFISKTVAAQVIGSSGSEQSRSIYIDKGWRDGIRPDMAVITADGVVGKVLQVFGQKPLEASTSEVLLINDQSSGVGAILEKTRLQGILRGSATGEVVLEKVMADEQVQPGERVLTSGGDQIFPKGLSVGTVVKSIPGSDLFLNIKVKPSADLSKLEEVLVITKTEDKAPEMTENSNMRAVDILAQRLPSVPQKPVEDPNKSAPGTASPVPAKPDTKPNLAGVGSPQTGTAAKPTGGVSPMAKPAGTPLVKPVIEQTGLPAVVKTADVPAPKVKKQAPPPPVPETDPAQPPPAEDRPQ
jgi:rod shape-determining protein MreC